ncbi:MAG: response regulator transcription factor [Peptococcaceae bacterium]|nr:response regulator transcription factor [Peptococcaceae bacterium]
MASKLLLLEDDQSLIDGLVYALMREGYELDVVMNVAQAQNLLNERRYDLLLLDITLPDGNGVDVCKWVRARGNAVPIIFLTALDEEVQVIRALDGGGDDYITKPFKLGELCSRIRVQLRRSGAKEGTGDGVLTSGRLRVEGGRVFIDGETLVLTATEYRLLCLFLRHKEQTLSRQMILDALWDEQGNFVDDNTLSVYIRRLREKVEDDPANPVHLITVRGVGYGWREGQ